MSIYIPGMKMPTNCLECVFYRSTDPVYDYCCISSATPNGYVPDDCPLVPIPEHGRLIDANELLKRAIGTKCFRGDYALMLEELAGESTTIIPADKEGE